MWINHSVSQNRRFLDSILISRIKWLAAVRTRSASTFRKWCHSDRRKHSIIPRWTMTKMRLSFGKVEYFRVRFTILFGFGLYFVFDTYALSTILIVQARSVLYYPWFKWQFCVLIRIFSRAPKQVSWKMMSYFQCQLLNSTVAWLQ